MRNFDSRNVLIYISNLIVKGDSRDIKAKKNIFAMIVIKMINVLTGFMIVPLTIHYVNATIYGIWLTISSVIVWIYYFDLGLPNGFRNKFAESKANGDVILARKYVSTTYALLSIVLAIFFLIILVTNEFLNWSEMLHVSPLLSSELHDICIILSLFVCLRIIVSIFTTLLMANQQPALSAAVQTLGQVLALVAIYVLTKTTTGNLFYLAIAISGIPCVTILAMSIYGYVSKPYKLYAPSLRYVEFQLTRKIMGKGLQFFVISLAIILLLQASNIIISRELGAIYVTQYNISFKYFSIIYMCMEMIAAPFWSGFTEAFTKGELLWMKNTLVKLEKLILLSVFVVVIMIIAADFVIKVWINDDEVGVPLALNVIMGVFVSFQSAYCVYSNLINGTGYARLQVITFVMFALVAIPMILFGIRLFGLCGSMIFPTATYIVLTLLCRIQIHKIVNNTAKGIWCK